MKKFLCALFVSIVGIALVFVPYSQSQVALPSFNLNSDTVANIAEKQAASVVSLEISAQGKKAIPFVRNFDLGGLPFKQVIPKIISQEGKVGDGSGFIVSEDGYIVTNHHVINPTSNGRSIEPSKIEVILDNGEKYKATVIGEDEDSDIAVIKVDAKN
ncbi:MAG TPA: trypsin-like peptidase domain-containing protein, partial [Vampirovibrionales bacterium]